MRFEFSTRRLRLTVGSCVAMVLASASASRAAPDAEPQDEPVEEIVITSERLESELETEQALTPGGIALVDGASLYERSVTNMADMLRYVPGLWAESGWGSDELFFSSRGSNLDATDYDKNGIKLLQDGLPVTAADGNNHNRVLDPLSQRFAIVARGANALTYGASTLGGALDFTSPTARTLDPLALYLNRGSSGLLSTRLTLGGLAGDVDGLVTLEMKSTDGYRDHSRQDRKGIYANAGWELSETLSTRVFATYIDNDEELPRGLTREQIARDPDQVQRSALTGDNRKDLQTSRFAFKTTWEIDGSSSLQFGVSYEDQSLYHPIVDVRIDPDGDGPAPEFQAFSLLVDTDHRSVGGMVRYNKRIGDHDVLLGAHYGDTEDRGGNYQNLFGRRNGLSQIVHNRSDSVEGFVMDRWQVSDALTLVYGTQLVHTDRDVSVIDVSEGSVRNPKGDFSSINPRVGFVYALGESGELFANVSRVFEAPTTFELEDDITPGNDLLDPMRGRVVELGLRGSAALASGLTWSWDVAAYYAQIRDEILSSEDPESPGTSQSRNVDATVHAGIEALFGASIPLWGSPHRVEPLVSLTLNEFSFDSDSVYGNNDLPAAPRYAVRGELMYRHPSGFYLGPTFDLVGKRYADFANTFSVDSYTLLGLRGGFRAERWEVFAELRNLLDEDYISTVSVRDRAGAEADVLFPGAPLSAYVGVRLRH